METNRIERKGQVFFGHSQYIQETKKKKISTEKVKVETYNPVEMSFETTGLKTNILV